MAFGKIVAAIRKRSREEWEDIPRTAYADARTWIQANPERAAGAAFVVGIFLVLAFKLVFTVVFLGFALALVVWQIALPAAEMKGGGSAANSAASAPTDD